MKPGPRLAVSGGDAQRPDEATEDAPNRRGGKLPAAPGEEDVLERGKLFWIWAVDSYAEVPSSAFERGTLPT
jgi:hypothetical protein